MVGIKSDVGLVRKLNEDYADYLETEDYGLYVVTDGMGGHNAGEVASVMAAKSLIKYFSDNYEGISEGILKAAVLYANDIVYEYSHKDVEYNGMGTTLTACLVTKDCVKIANVGDSCCYGYNGNELIKITKDHSLVQELLEVGSITIEEAEKHPQKNVITRAIGTSDWVDVDIFEVKSSDFKKFLLCSDGLTNELDKNDVIDVIKNYNNYKEACERLVEIAKSRGGRDNITVMLFGGEV